MEGAVSQTQHGFAFIFSAVYHWPDCTALTFTPGWTGALTLYWNVLLFCEQEQWYQQHITAVFQERSGITPSPQSSELLESTDCSFSRWINQSLALFQHTSFVKLKCCHPCLSIHRIVHQMIIFSHGSTWLFSPFVWHKQSFTRVPSNGSCWLCNGC